MTTSPFVHIDKQAKESKFIAMQVLNWSDSN